MSLSLTEKIHSVELSW